MFTKIKLYFRRKKFNKYCLRNFVICTSCPYFVDGERYGKCLLAVQLGLED